MTHGIAHEVGSIEVGKLADLVLWKPAFFGVKPELVLKGGFIAWAQMGDPNASIPTPQPVLMRPMFGALAARPERRRWRSCRSCRSTRDGRRYGLGKRTVGGARLPHGGKRDMKLNDALPRIHVDAETYVVTADGEELRAKPADVLPLAQRYFLF